MKVHGMGNGIGALCKENLKTPYELTTDESEVTCKKCLKLINQEARKTYSEKIDEISATLERIEKKLDKEKADKEYKAFTDALHSATFVDTESMEAKKLLLEIELLEFKLFERRNFQEMLNKAKN
jgi:hypothetical protein